MKTNHLILAFIAFLSINSFSYSQAFSQEIGATIGPVAFKSDYGLRGNSETNFGNVGFGVGLMHYINFSFRADCNCYSDDTYFNDHFKIRTELDYHVTGLDHFGKFAEKNDDNGLRLRSMHGKAKVLEIGPSLEWYFRSIRDFDGGNFNFAPYASLGIHYVSYSPEATTDLPGTIGSPSNTYPTFVAPPGEDPYIDTTSSSTYALVWSVGTRYRLNDDSDLVLDARWHYYGSDFVDGLDHNNPQNKANDWIFWLNIGYVYYLD
ncbi:glutamate dehydrogenase [Mesonia sp.]|uniref:THC0290_0291 family protein n=1 Tax=Mesonia sp. TaxID=1960830 RepID=UPI001765B579|nr:glutamate dehydrogenase [Mesonia sp.]HIB37916.1 glutamate dehydrogenase [Mesonia sp.]